MDVSVGWLGATTLPGREPDARVARIVFALAHRGLRRCPVSEPATGMLLQHLSQFERDDRPKMIAAYALDRGPGIVAVVPGGPASHAGLRAGDVLLAVDDVALPPEPGLSAPFAASQARARADRIDGIVRRAAASRVITVLRDGATMSVQLLPAAACPAHAHLARSGQRNAYADGRHVFITTGLLALIGGDDELAFVIAHEMAHNILGHAATMRGPDVKRGLSRMLGRSGKVVRATEREADTLGGQLMLDAGYDPVDGAAVLRRLGGGLLGIDIFAAHAPASERIATMRALVRARRDP